MEKQRVIAAVRNNIEFSDALSSDVEIIFMLETNIFEIKKQTDAAHKSGKKLFIHLDLTAGIGKDEDGIRFVKEQGVDGIISTRTNLIKAARKTGIFTVQRFFIVDSHSVRTTIDTAQSSKADMIEIMPGTISKVIKGLKTELDMPIVAGGLIRTKEEVCDALNSGAVAVSTGNKDLWK